MSQSGTYGSGGSGGGGITSLVGDNNGTASGSSVNILTKIFSNDYFNGTPSFIGDGVSTISLKTWDDNLNVGLGRSVFATGGPNGNIQRNTGVGWLVGQNLNGSGSPTGNLNCLFGYQAGISLDTGFNNCAFGPNALNNSATGLTGSFNIMIGTGAGEAFTTSESSNIYLNSTGTLGDSNTLRIGENTGSGDQQLAAAFICGIQGVVVAGATGVVIGTGAGPTADQLGTSASSLRFKKDIADMGNASEVLHKLRPVSFKWDPDSNKGLKNAPSITQYGLIAEEAAQHIPHAITYDKEGRPFNINYSDLIGMLINEIQILRKEVDSLKKANQ